jgi:hypothetical protein
MWSQRGVSVRRGRRGVGCGSGRGLSGNPDGASYDEKKIDKEDGDQDQTTDEDVGSESEHSLMSRKVGRRDVSVLGVVFVHVHQIRRKTMAMPGL